MESQRLPKTKQTSHTIPPSRRVWLGGDGIIERLHRTLIREYDYEISWNSKKQEYIWIADIKQEQLI